MHRLIRNLHLILGLASVPFVLTYAVSAVQMAHRIRATTTSAEEDVTLPAGLAARPLADELMRARGYGGELGNPQMTPTGFRVTIVRPGTAYTVAYNRTTGETHIRRDTRSLLGM